MGSLLCTNANPSLKPTVSFIFTQAFEHPYIHTHALLEAHTQARATLTLNAPSTASQASNPHKHLTRWMSDRA